jgi:hypothetical protein
MMYVLFIVGPSIVTLFAAAKMPLAAALAAVVMLVLMGWSIRQDRAHWLFYCLAAFMLAFAVKIL